MPRFAILTSVCVRMALPRLSKFITLTRRSVLLIILSILYGISFEIFQIYSSDTVIHLKTLSNTSRW